MTEKAIGNHFVNIAIGVLGMTVIIYGNFVSSVTPQKICYLLGGLFMLTTALLERQQFFSVLQVIIVAGTAMALTWFHPAIKASVPILLGVVGSAYFLRRGELKDPLAIVGCSGILFIAVGYAISLPVIYFLGGSALAIYAFSLFFRGERIALLWAVLNTLFALTALRLIFL